jgi:hypothetical protein
MRLLRRIAVIAVAAMAGEAVKADERAVSLPTGFDGDYAPEGVACGSDMAVKVNKGTFVSGDGEMTIIDLIRSPDQPNKVKVRLLTSRRPIKLLATGGYNGGKWTEWVDITLAQGPTLIIDYPDGKRSIWTRCKDT